MASLRGTVLAGARLAPLRSRRSLRDLRPLSLGELRGPSWSTLEPSLPPEPRSGRDFLGLLRVGLLPAGRLAYDGAARLFRSRVRLLERLGTWEMGTPDSPVPPRPDHPRGGWRSAIALGGVSLVARLMIAIPSVVFVCAMWWIGAAVRDPILVLITGVAVTPFGLYLIWIRSLTLSLLAGGAMLGVTLWLYIASARDTTSSTAGLGFVSAFILDYFILGSALALQAVVEWAGRKRQRAD